MAAEPAREDKRSEIMGYMRPMNAFWLALLFAATWAFWSLRAALISLGLLVVSTLLTLRFRRNGR